MNIVNCKYPTIKIVYIYQLLYITISLQLLPSGKLTVRYWKWPFVVDLPIKNGDFL